MKHATNCKFCRQPITVEIDDGYAELGDPYELLKLAACNRCVDLRVERRRLEAAIGSACNQWALMKRPDSDDVARTRGALEALTRKYASLIARWHGRDGMAWDEEGVNLLLDKPRHWPQVLHVYWDLFRDWQKQNPNPEPSYA